MNGEVTAAHPLRNKFGVGHGGKEMPAEAEKDFHAPIVHRLGGVYGVEAVFAGRG